MEATLQHGGSGTGARPGAVSMIGSIELACGLAGLGVAWLAQSSSGSLGAALALAGVSLVRLWIGGGLFAGVDGARLLLSWLVGIAFLAQFPVIGCWIVRGAPWGDSLPPAAAAALIAFHLVYPWLVLWNLSGPPAFEWFQARRRELESSAHR